MAKDNGPYQPSLDLPSHSGDWAREPWLGKLEAQAVDGLSWKRGSWGIHPKIVLVLIATLRAAEEEREALKQRLAPLLELELLVQRAQEHEQAWKDAHGDVSHVGDIREALGG